MEEPDTPIIPTSPLVDPFVFAKHYTDDPSPSTQTVMKSLVLDDGGEEEGVEETSEFTRAFRSSGVYPTPRRRTEEYEQSKLAHITSVESDSSEITDTETETETETDADHVGTDLDDASDSEVPDLDALDAELSRVDNMIALPDEVIVYVIRFLRLNDVMSLLESSRKFSWIRTNKDIWSHLYTYYDRLLGPLFEDGADVNVWDDEPVVGPLPPNPRIPPPSPELTRDRPVFSSTNSVSSFFFPPSNPSEEARKPGRTFTTTNLTLHSSIKEPKSSSAAQSFLLPSSRLTAAPASPSKDTSHRHASFITKNKPASFSSLHVLTDNQTKSVSNTPTFPPKNQKHKWVFPKRTVPAGSTSKKGGLSAVSEDSPSIVISPHSPVPMHRPSFFQHEEPPSPSAGTLNGTLQQLTPASTVPSSTSIEKFLNTYFQTTTPSTLIRKLIQRYHVPRKIAPGLSDVEFHVKIERPVRLRVCKLLKSVFEDVHLEWSPLLVSLVKVFINGFIDKNSDLTRMLSKSLLKRFPGGKPILHFSRPILEVVLRNLELSDLCRASQVCKMWNEVSSQSAVWHDLFNYYETLTIGGDSKEVSLWEDIRQSPSFESDYAISSAEILSIPGKSPPASPSFPRQNSGDLSSHFLRHSRSSLSADSLIVSPPSSPAPNYPPPPIPAHARRPDILPELDPPVETPIDITVTTPTSAPSSRSHSPTTVPLEEIVQALAITPSSSNPPSPNTSAINMLAQPGSTSPSSSTLNLHEDLDDGHTPMLNRVLKHRASRGHQRTGSETTMNMKKISLNQLVESLTPVSTLPDLMDINAFLMTYRTFTSPQHLVRKLLQRYLVPRELFHNMNDSDFKVSIEYPIQLRVCKILKQLIDSHWTDLDALTVTFLKVFVRGIVDKNSPLGPALLRSMNKEGSKTPSVYVGNKEKVTKKFVLTRRLSEMPSGIKLKHVNDVLRNDPLEVAQQLCLIEYQNFKVLKPSEFFQQAWAKANADKSAPNIRASIGRFNEVTKWIVSMVVQQEKLSKRVKTLQKLILIAKHLRDLNNFHTLMAFLAGINDGPIFRLKFTLGSIPESKMKLLEELQSLMNADSNYENYRQQLAMVPSTQPCIPYLGVCLRDLTYYEEGDTTKSSEGGMINFKQSKNVYSVLHYISVHQKIPYPFEVNSSLQTQLKDLPTLEDDDHIHKLSLLREPRNAKRSDIL